MKYKLHIFLILTSIILTIILTPADLNASDMSVNQTKSLYMTSEHLCSEFIDGHAIVETEIELYRWAYYMINRSGTVICRTGENSYYELQTDKDSKVFYTAKWILDTNGNYIYKANDYQKILCVGNGLVVVYELPHGIDSSVGKIGVVDLEGNWYIPFQDSPPVGDVKYIGSGCFATDYKLINSYEGRIFDCNNKAYDCTKSLRDGFPSV